MLNCTYISKNIFCAKSQKSPDSAESDHGVLDLEEIFTCCRDPLPGYQLHSCLVVYCISLF